MKSRTSSKSTAGGTSSATAATPRSGRGAKPAATPSTTPAITTAAAASGTTAQTNTKSTAAARALYESRDLKHAPAWDQLGEVTRGVWAEKAAEQQTIERLCAQPGARTDGQRLYESKHPALLLVVEFSNRKFATADDAFLTPNPATPTPWHLLTKRAQRSWEDSAVGHHLFSKAPT